MTNIKERMKDFPDMPAPVDDEEDEEGDDLLHDKLWQEEQAERRAEL